MIARLEPRQQVSADLIAVDDPVAESLLLGLALLLGRRLPMVKLSFLEFVSRGLKGLGQLWRESHCLSFAELQVHRPPLGVETLKMLRAKRRRAAASSPLPRLLCSEAGPGMVLAEFLCAREIFRLSVVLPSFGKAARRKRVVLRQVKESIMDAFACVVPDMKQDALFEALRRSHGVISGSVVLRALDPQAARWHARDLDIFVPSSYFAKKFMHFLDHQGKLYRDDPNSGRLQNYPNSLEIHNLRLRPRARTTLSPFLAVQIMVSNTYDVAEHVAGFDLAFLRNWCDGSRLVVGDVSAVCKRRSAVTRWPTGRPHKFLRWLDTYSRRGYSFSNLRMVPRSLQGEGLQGVQVYIMEHDARCVGVFFRKDTFLENLKRLAGDDQAVLAVLPHVRSSIKPIFRDFAFVTAVHCYLPQGLDNEALGLDTEPLFARLREIKSAFV